MDVDRISTSISGIYATALYWAVNGNCVAVMQIKEELSIFNKLRSRKMDKVFSSYSVQADNALRLFEVLSTWFSEKFLNFLKIVVYNNRYSLLPSIESIYGLICDSEANIQRVNVTSAVDLSDDQKCKLEKKLSERYNKNVVASYILDDSIIAGLVLTTNAIRIDMSVKNDLKQLREYLKGAYYEK